MKKDYELKKNYGKNKTIIIIFQTSCLFFYSMSYKDSIGVPAVTVFDANRAPLLLDSKYRDSVTSQSPYSFTAQLASNVVVSEMFYSKLYWNQPFFSHNALSSELQFQVKFPDNSLSEVYVVYAAPFMMFGEFDGNVDGTYFESPQPGSYADMMEKGLNYDVRLYTSNMTPITEGADTGRIYHNVLPVVFRFRYSASRGFGMYCYVDNDPNQEYCQVKILPCQYVSNAHYTHGFGIFDANTSSFRPRGQFVETYFSDGTPTLLPYKYIVIGSVDLTRDRRATSFGVNASGLNLTDEVAVFPLNAKKTGTYHVLTSGDDSTVFALRSNYTPSQVSIRMTTDSKSFISCGDPLGHLFGLSSMSVELKKAYLDPTSIWYGRGAPSFINFLVFGTNIAAAPLLTTWFSQGSVFQNRQILNLPLNLPLDSFLALPFDVADLTFVKTTSKYPHYPAPFTSNLDTTGWQRTSLRLPAVREANPPTEGTFFVKNAQANNNLLPTIVNATIDFTLKTPNWPVGDFRTLKCVMCAFRKVAESPTQLWKVVWRTSGVELLNIGGSLIDQQLVFPYAAEGDPSSWQRMEVFEDIMDGENLCFGWFFIFNDGGSFLPNVLYDSRLDPGSVFTIQGATPNNILQYVTGGVHFPPGGFGASVVFPDYNSGADALCEDIIHEFIGVMETS